MTAARMAPRIAYVPGVAADWRMPMPDLPP